MLGCERHLVTVVPYQPAWAKLYQQEAECLSAALGSQVIRIEHVGSTAVPGLDAKPILDIVVAVRDMTDAAVFEEAFRPLGYVHKAENDRPGRLYFVKRTADDRSTHHLNITELGTECWFTHVAFRDCLREHPETRDEYRTLKLDLAHRHPTDRTGYQEGKGVLIKQIPALAREGQTDDDQRKRPVVPAEGFMPVPEATTLTRQDATALLAEWLGRKARCQSIVPLTGGIASPVFRLAFDRPPYSAVVKLSEGGADDPLPLERGRLDHLHQHTKLPCPQVYLQDDSRAIIPYSFLLLECLPGVNLGAAQIRPEQRGAVERELAEALLELHSHRSDAFGDIEGKSTVSRWNDLFLPDLEEGRHDMREFLLPSELAELDRAVSLAEEALSIAGEPTLIHNDVWAGNIMVQERDDGWHLSGLLDPIGLKYAEAEKELAYLQAFDTVGAGFFDTYTAQRPLREGFEFRRLFYWLETYMVHVWLGFGAEFRDRVVGTSRQVVAMSQR